MTNPSDLKEYRNELAYRLRTCVLHWRTKGERQLAPSTLDDLANLVGLKSGASITDLCRRDNPKITERHRALPAFARVFEVELDFILCGEPEPSWYYMYGWFDELRNSSPDFLFIDQSDFEIRNMTGGQMTVLLAILKVITQSLSSQSWFRSTCFSLMKKVNDERMNVFHNKPDLHLHHKQKEGEKPRQLERHSQQGRYQILLPHCEQAAFHAMERVVHPESGKPAPIHLYDFEAIQNDDAQVNSARRDMVQAMLESSKPVLPKPKTRKAKQRKGEDSRA